MMRLIPALCVAAAMGFGCTVSTYGSRRGYDRDDNRPVAVTGCLRKARSGGYILTAPGYAFDRDDRDDRGDRDDRERAERRDRDDDARRVGGMWKLEHGPDLDDHVNQLVQVVGRPEDDFSTVRPTRDSDKIRVRDFNVQGMRVLGPCR